MDLVYADYNCFQRGFDDPGQVRIRLEAVACEELFYLAEQGAIRMVWSFMHEDETLLCPFPGRKLEVMRLASVCTLRIAPLVSIRDLAKSYQRVSAISAKDALHVACAAHSGASHFLTCDDRLLIQCRLLDLGLERMNPVEYLRRR